MSEKLLSCSHASKDIGDSPKLNNKQQIDKPQKKSVELTTTTSISTTSQTKKQLDSMTSIRLIFVGLMLMVLVASSIVECIKRTQYHEQGVHGPHSYKFGYTSGDHKNPQERHEVSDKKGHVKGWYSYKDPHGKMMVFHYEAHPKKGFKVHKYKEHHHHHHHHKA